MLKLILILCIHHAFASVEVGKSYADYRLPTTILPEHYVLEIFTDLEGFTFNGIVTITMNVEESCSKIVLHSNNLTIPTNDIELFELSQNEVLKTSGVSEAEAVKINRVELEPKNNFLIIYPERTLLEKQKILLKIKFAGTLDRDLTGYYRSAYYDKASKSNLWLTVTKFEPYHAREAFPCFDEPAMKATFDVSLAHHKKYHSVSNMPLKETKPIDEPKDFVMDTFETSVKMSTYLVAYSVSDFEYREAPPDKENGVTFRIYARRDYIDQVDYALEIGPKVLKHFEKYFDIPYPIKKMDMLAIPDFGPGAMENYGCITYKEALLLYKEGVSNLDSKYRIARVIAHEIAHQWFGNLVTMKWWNDLWLNEGFATYVASLGVGYLHPEWKTVNEDSVGNMLSIYKIDALKSTQPISVTIGPPSDIRKGFGSITYTKGALICRMMHHFLGEESFRTGVSNYLKKYQFANAEQDDLWASLSEVAHEKQSLDYSLFVKTIMDTWTLQKGYPIIEVTRDYERNSAKITQIRYLSDRYNTRNELDSCWWIPLTYTDSVRKNFDSYGAQDWMRCTESKQAEEKIIQNLPDKTQWVIFNKQMAGVYKTQYDRTNYELIINTLKSEEFDTIDPINRAQLIDDAMDLAWKQKEYIGTAFDMMEYLEREPEYLPWKAALDKLKIMENLLSRSPNFYIFRGYVAHILKPIYAKLGGISNVPEMQAFDNAKHQALICTWSCSYNVGDCISTSVDYFDKWMIETDPDNINPVPLNLRLCIYCNAIRNGNEKHWRFLYKRYERTNVVGNKIVIAVALACSKKQWLITRYLDWSLNSTLIRNEDASTVFESVARDESGFYIARNFFFERFDDIYETLYPDTWRLAEYVEPLAEQMSSEKDLHELRELVRSKENQFEKAKMAVKRALETVELNNQWKRSSYKALESQLSHLRAQFDTEDDEA